MGERIFINCSNHTSMKWSKEQREAAQMYGKVEDLPFPEVDPAWGKDEIFDCAERVCEIILAKEPDAVMCQGEFTLTYAVVARLKKENIKVVAACSRRQSEEVVRADGSTEKRNVFKFVRFREY